MTIGAELATGAETRGAPTLLIVATVSSTIGGFLIPFARHLRAKGWRVEGAAYGATTEQLMAGEFDAVHDLPVSRSVLHVRRNASSVPAARRLLGATRPDIVHVHTPIAGFVTRFAVRLLPAHQRPAVVYTAHGFHFSSGGNPVANAGYRLIERVAGRWTDRLVVINEEDRDAALRARIVPRQHLVHMPGIGIDLAHFARPAVQAGTVAAARESCGIPPSAPILIMVAEFNRNKRHEDLLRAFAAMHDQRTHLLLAGQGPLRPRVQALATQLGVADRVHFTGYVLDIRPLIVASDVLILPSGREGLARSVMEAAALEVPVIASTARGNRELIGDEAGIVFTTGDVPALTRALDWMRENPDAAAEMGRRGRARMARLFDLQIVLRMHEALYAELLAEHQH